MIEEMLEAVRTARASQATADRDHEIAKQKIIQARVERGEEYGPADLEELTGKYLDRATISRLTAPAMRENPVRKKTRRKPRTGL